VLSSVFDKQAAAFTNQPTDVVGRVDMLFVLSVKDRLLNSKLSIKLLGGFKCKRLVYSFNL
jgi:hypothetical protein